MAIPVTLMWRVVEGEWPSQSLATTNARATLDAGVSPVVAKIMASFDGIARLEMAPIAAIYDGQTAKLSAAPFGQQHIDAGSIGRFVLGVVLVGTTFPLLRTVGNAAPSALTWSRWGVGAAAAVVQAFGISFRSLSTELFNVLSIAVSYINAVLGIVVLVLAAIDLVNNRNANIASDFDFAATAAAALAAILNPMKFIPTPPDLFDLIVIILDVALWSASAVMAFIEAGFTQ
jgi:hypothetical protein